MRLCDTLWLCVSGQERGAASPRTLTRTVAKLMLNSIFPERFLRKLVRVLRLNAQVPAVVVKQPFLAQPVPSRCALRQQRPLPLPAGWSEIWRRRGRFHVGAPWPHPQLHCSIGGAVRLEGARVAQAPGAQRLDRRNRRGQLHLRHRAHVEPNVEDAIQANRKQQRQRERRPAAPPLRGGRHAALLSTPPLLCHGVGGPVLRLEPAGRGEV